MKRAKILLVNFAPSEKLGDDLGPIIQSQFELEEVKIGVDHCGDVSKGVISLWGVTQRVCDVRELAEAVTHISCRLIRRIGHGQ